MPRYSVSRKRAILILALTSVLLITLDLQGSSLVSGARGAFGRVFRPVERATRVVTRPIENAWRGITDYDDLRDENRRLQEQIDQQEGAFIAALASVRDTQELLAINGIDNLADISSITAQVIGNSPSNFAQTVEINQGSRDGLAVGMLVVNAAGLVGKITEVSSDRSVVMLATDTSFNVSAIVVNVPEDPGTTTTTSTTTSTTTTSTSTTSTTSTSLPTNSTTTTTPIDLSGVDFEALTTTTLGPIITVAPPAPSTSSTSSVPLEELPAAETGLFRGRGADRAPIVEFIDQNSRFGEVRVGALVLSSGGSASIAPRGIVIGRVVKITERTGTQGVILEVRMSATLSNLNFVRVLLYQPVAAGGQ